ncbi:hypothetical protein ABZU32_11750 [Sphaerisporangium sp. NPDC005288]|uniref:hypothetical protein n=1 Tax=Sphaerisporangium sp. NPDC005288 TaxID=3155114 RepID=UPI0033A55D36
MGEAELTPKRLFAVRLTELLELTVKVVRPLLRDTVDRDQRAVEDGIDQWRSPIEDRVAPA